MGFFCMYLLLIFISASDDSLTHPVIEDQGKITHIQEQGNCGNKAYKKSPEGIEKCR